MPAIPELEKIRKSQIIEAAVKTISARGHANVKMEDIAKASGLSKGGIAHYYASKEILFQAAFSAYFDHVFALVEELIGRHSHPMDKLLGFEALFDAERKEVILGYPLIYDLMTLAVHYDNYRKLFQSWVDRWVALLASIIEDGIEQDIFITVDAHAYGRTLSAVYQGFATRWYLGDKNHSADWAILSFKQTIKALLSTIQNQKVKT
jgi:AcrR family transcriptional regulator